jgi:hypothetical protein
MRIANNKEYKEAYPTGKTVMRMTSVKDYMRKDITTISTEA